MSTTQTRTEQAVVGRRVEFAFYSNLHGDAKTVWHPGTITATEPGLACIRLDGERRSGLHTPLDYEGLRYLDQVVAVPELPMGRFQPGTEHPGMHFVYGGVLVVEFDDGDLAAITDDRDKAEVAVAAYLREQAGLEAERAIGVELAALKPQWAVFEWQPEDAEYDWCWESAEEGDDQAVRIHYLPA